MPKSKIEWLRSTDGKPGYTINPVKGVCPVACPYCYARRLYKRFKWDETIRCETVGKIEKTIEQTEPGDKIFIGSTMELFGGWVEKDWMDWIMDIPHIWKDRTFIFLTKRPENLIKYSPFPDNCWVGVSVTNSLDTFKAVNGLSRIESRVKFISFEPLLSWDGLEHLSIVLENNGINWLIIGQQTPVKASTMPKIEWIGEIAEAANQARIPLFLKDNLKPLLISPEGYAHAGVELLDWTMENGTYKLRQELPNV